MSTKCWQLANLPVWKQFLCNWAALMDILSMHELKIRYRGIHLGFKNMGRVVNRPENWGEGTYKAEKWGCVIYHIQLVWQKVTSKIGLFILSTSFHVCWTDHAMHLSICSSWTFVYDLALLNKRIRRIHCFSTSILSKL